ncbi:MAG: hypothetical protein DHS20C01_17710 [marine bacterium B5-7]|nr:MAG: hypothetical protein DHS20C01_17710 [marine bacterium B5-7]
MLSVASSSVALDSRASSDKGTIADPDQAVHQAISYVNSRYKGRVLSAKPVTSKQGVTRIRVKFLSKDGVVKILFFDPAGE